jgi:hypothetical protein
MFYHFTSRARWERIVEDGELRALSPPDPAFEPKVVHLTVSASVRGMPLSVDPEVVLSIDESPSLRRTSFLEWWSLELPPTLQPLFEADLRGTPDWPTRPEVHWYVVKGPIPRELWLAARTVADDAPLWP